MNSQDELLATLQQCGVPESALSLRMIRASGPGGQHVNKVSTAIQLTCDVQQCALSEHTRSRLAVLAGRRLGNDQIITLVAQRLRTQELNRRDALTRLVELIEAARVMPKTRRATRPTRASQQRRLDSKQTRSEHKQRRRKVSHDD